jgi:hypothetical protein
MSLESVKPPTVRPVDGLRNSAGCGGLNNSQHNEANQDRQECVLATLRSANLRVRLIDNEIAVAGTALECGLVSPKIALERVEDVAPGCVRYLPIPFAEGNAA